MWSGREGAKWASNKMWHRTYLREDRFKANTASFLEQRRHVLRRPLDLDCVFVVSNYFRSAKNLLTASNSPSFTETCLRRRRIREEIIGRTSGLSLVSIAARRQDFARLMLHQPTRQHGRGKLFHPLIEHWGNFLSQIGRVAQSRQFIALKTVTRCGQEELPRRERMTAEGHGISPE